MKRTFIPATLMGHSLANLIYFYDPQKTHWKSFGWATYFHCTQALFICVFCTVFALVNKKSFFDNQFLLIEVLYNLALTVAFILNFNGILQHTYGLIITCLSIISCTGIILLFGIKHDLLKN